MRSWVLFICLCLAGTVAGESRPGAPDFTRDVRPILGSKCFRCHGHDARARQSGLRLDEREAATATLRSGRVAIVPGDASASEVVRRITSDDEDVRMPPPESKLALSERERKVLVEWIESGAEYDRHWAFEPLRAVALPEVRRLTWPRNGIDRFVLARLEREGHEPSRPAERHRLVRRLYLDLLGVPPSPAEADAFIADRDPGAWERLVDRVLASPAFGERMAWDWLAAARYADSNGYQGDRERTMWPWRDWVVDAFNRGLPYDDFTVWQLAGDMLPEATFEQRLATGFCRNHPINGEGGRIPEENRVDYVMDMTETTGTVWLGLTMNCCRCHDHKYDRLKQRDYYSLFAFFNQTPVDGGGGDPQTPPVVEAPTDEQREELERLWRAVAERVEAVVAAEQTALARAGDAPGEPEGETPAVETPEEIRKILERPARDRGPKELKKLEEHFGSSQPEYAGRLRSLRETIERRDGLRRSLPRVMVMEDMEKRRSTFMLAVGLYNKPGEEVSAAVPVSLPGMPESLPRNRLGLAQWLVAAENPLTARVAVNRMWQQFFGVGLVKTAEDFGVQGEAPSHPGLLDWLALELRGSGWDVKRLFRLIVTSATYRQSSRVSPALLERDPDNRLLARGARFRLPSWAIRDQALATSGLLVARLGGPPVFPYQPEGVWSDATFGKKKYRRDEGEKLYRRSLYTFWRRIVAPSLFFDVASRQTCTVRESRTNTPLHALTTLNDATFFEAARVLATRVSEELPGATGRDLVVRAFRRVLIRPPRDDEERILVGRLEALERHFAAEPQAASAILSSGAAPAPETDAPARLAALAAVCNVILNLDETLTRE